MIIDKLENASRYYSVHGRIKEAFEYLRTTDLATIAPGKYAIDGDELFVIVQEYETKGAEDEQMESHKKYVDVQYMITGAEQVGHALLKDQVVSRPYSSDEDYMLYSDSPEFFSVMAAGTFMVFFSNDLHMPCIKIDGPAIVKKVVVKVRTR